MQARGYTPFACTFASFLTRAHDFFRMAAISGADLNVIGSHAGVAIGQDGPVQMGLEDLALFRSVHASTVLYPSDANQTAKLVAAMAKAKGIRYLRTNRGETRWSTVRTRSSRSAAARCWLGCCRRGDAGGRRADPP